MVKTNLNKGYVTQIIGPVLDIEFPDGIYHLFTVQLKLN
jgi:F0F1-type ATP synthase beta subunit